MLWGNTSLSCRSQLIDTIFLGFWVWLHKPEMVTHWTFITLKYSFLARFVKAVTENGWILNYITNVGQFSKFFACGIPQEIRNRFHAMFPTSPKMCRSTTLQNLNLKFITIVIVDPCELIASGSRDKSVRLWNWSQGQTVATLRLPSSAGGHARQSADEYGKQRVWTALSWQCYDQLISTGLKCVTVLFWMLYSSVPGIWLILWFLVP